ncbi:MAG: molybdopterin-dependent oxidoreductase [Acidimicrobiales bacterium]
MPEQLQVLGACPHDCPDTCSMVVTVEDGRVTRVRGNPDHPFTRGGLCVKVTDFPNHLYSTDRVTTPLRRVGAKGEGRFEPIGWDEALDEIADRFGAIIDRHGPEAILPYSYLGNMGILNGLTVGDRFFNGLGTSVSERTFCDGGGISAYLMTLGPTAAVDPESLVHSRYIVIWACNVLSNNLHLWPFIEEAQRRGAKVVCIDPVRHRTAEKADWHLPIRPGTDAALALALMHVIIGEGLHDAGYVADHTVGFDELAAHVERYTPDWAEGETGIPADDIRTLARELATTPPAMIRVGVALERSTGGGNAARAVFALPALIGSWREVGGGVLQMPIWAFPVAWDELHGPHPTADTVRIINQWELGRALTGGFDGPPIEALFVYNSNPAVVTSAQRSVLDGLARDDLFVVVSEHFVTDTARYADIVLPAAMAMEQTDLMFSWGHLYLTYSPKVIEPQGEAVANNELFRRLAHRMGIDDPWFDLDDDEQLQRSLDWAAPQMEGIDLDRLKADGYIRLALPPADVYAPHRDGNFPTPSGRVELVSSMAAGGNFVAPLFRQGIAGNQDGGHVDTLPTYHPPREVGADERFPLALVSPKAHAFLNSQYANMDKQLTQQGPQTCRLNADDAAARGIADRSPVRVFNERAAVSAVARVGTDVAPGVVVMPMGHWPSGSPDGLAVNALNSTRFADIGRAPTFSDTAVEVEAAPG